MSRDALKKLMEMADNGEKITREMMNEQADALLDMFKGASAGVLLCVCPPSGPGKLNGGAAVHLDVDGVDSGTVGSLVSGILGVAGALMQSLGLDLAKPEIQAGVLAALLDGPQRRATMYGGPVDDDGGPHVKQ